ncbi:glycosyltransferase [bacterium]|nr:glycosyltransferase [bacterium]
MPRDRTSLRPNPVIRDGTSSRVQLFRAEFAIVVTSHNYGRFLAECLESVLSQTPRPREIVVIDDASEDDTRAVAESFATAGVRYLRIEAHNVYLARAAGFAATRAPFLVFLDADDRLGSDYLLQAASQFGDPTVGIVFSDLQLFGDKAGTRVLNPRPISQMNYIHAGSAVRRVALEISNAFARIPPDDCHGDWYLWRRVLSSGWKARKCNGRYDYRIHANSMQQGRLGWQRSYYCRAALDHEIVTIAVALAGRQNYWPQFRQWLETQTWPHAQCRLLFLDSGDAEFSAMIRRWLSEQDEYQHYRYVRRPDSQGLADQDRRIHADAVQEVQRVVPSIYNQLAPLSETEYLLIIEDDILPPTTVIQGLLQGMDGDVAAVSGVYRSRYEPERFVAWVPGPQHLRQRNFGIQDIGGSGFGCLLLRRSVLSEIPLHHGGPTGNYDHSFAETVAERGLRWRLHWGVPCQHAGLPAWESKDIPAYGLADAPRHLLYHIYPKRGEFWRWNLRQLLLRWDLFTGQKIVGIATDEQTESFESVVQAFGDRSVEFFSITNDPELGEATTFGAGLQRLERQDGFVFRGHAKGVTHEGTHRESNVRRWVQHLYETSLDDWPTVADALSHKRVAGPLLRRGHFPNLGSILWHYSGSFYWFDLATALNRSWQPQTLDRFTAEAWPALVFGEQEAACLGNFAHESPYSDAAWIRT